MAGSTRSRRGTLLLTLSAYLTLAAVAIVGFLKQREAVSRGAAAGLLVAFGLLLLWTPNFGDSQRRGHLYLALQTAFVAGLLMLPSGAAAFPILFFVLSAQAAMVLPQRPALIWILGFTAVTAAATMRAYGWPDGLTWLLPYSGGYFFFAVFANALNQVEAAHRELRAAHQQLQEFAAQARELTMAEERNRLAREMHDSIGHRLTVTAVQLEGAQRLAPADPDRAARMIETARDEVKQALTDLRRTVAALRAPLEVDLPLAESLAKLANTFQEASGVAVHLTLPGDLPRLNDATRLALYRAAQEALTNAQRHATAEQVWIDLLAGNGQLTLIVSDDGKGLPPSADNAGFGLVGLRERAAQLGGAVILESRPGGGAQLRFTLPISSTDGTASRETDEKCVASVSSVVH